MKEILMAKGAYKLVQTCAGIQAGERVLVVTDYLTEPIARAVASAAHSITQEVSILTMPPRTIDGEEPPECVAAAMKTVDVFFTPVARSITHTNATRLALAAGARGIMLTAFVPEMLIGGGIDADFERISPLCEWVASKWSLGKRVRITAPGGTELTSGIEGRKGNSHSGLAHKPGTMTTVPNVESSVSPVEGTSNGVIVADASIPYFDIGVLEQPVQYTVQDGRITGITGGAQATRVAEMMQNCNDPNVYNIAQLSIGLNPRCRLQGLMLEDEGVYGTCHVGIGTSTILGGGVKTVMHYDALIWKPTIEIDGECIMADGVLQHPLTAEALA